LTGLEMSVKVRKKSDSIPILFPLPDVRAYIYYLFYFSLTQMISTRITISQKSKCNMACRTNKHRRAYYTMRSRGMQMSRVFCAGL